MANAFVNRLLHLDQADLWVELVVVTDNFDLLADHPALGIDVVGNELELIEADLADAGAATRERIDIADLDGVFGRRRHGGHAEHGQPKRDRNNSLPHWCPP